MSALKEEFLEEIQKLGVLDIRRTSKPADEESLSLMGEIEGLNAAIKSIRDKKDEVTDRLTAEISALRKEYSAVEPWGDYDKEKLKAFSPRFYRCSVKKFDTKWEEEYAIVEISRTGDEVWFVLLGANEDFPLKEIPAPANTTGEISRLIADKEKALEEHLAELSGKQKDIPALQEKISSLKAELDRHLAGIGSLTAAEDKLTIFTGFAPTESDTELAGKLDSLEVLWFAEPAAKEDNPPIKLKNNAFTGQFEVLTGMYGMPVYDEFDPTPIVAPFFLLFFAMCMGDAGYGILLIIIAYLLKGRQGGLADLWKLIRFLGIGTLIVGTLLGTFFGMSLYEMSWVPQWLKNCMIVEGNIGKIAGYDPQMVLAILLGVFHICLALSIKAVCLTKRFGFKENVSTWGWTLLIVGGVITAAAALAGLDRSIVKIIVICIGAISALGIFIFNKPGRNPLLNIGAGLWDSYSMATGIMGDVLSYIRLYALGLAGGMLGAAFNELALMARGDDPTWQWIPFVIVLLFGHVLNLAMSCLGAFVHPLRLTFVEYFKNSGYEGQGVKYNPLNK